MKILVTGGTGYIGSNTCVELINNGYEVVIVDNLSNSKREVVNYIEQITKHKVSFYELDVSNYDALESVFKNQKIDAVIHFAGFKAVGESVMNPLKYYRNNLDNTLTLLELMTKYKVKHLVFSSSATVYGNPKTLPIKEDDPLMTTNPYGTTKLMIEDILRDVYRSDPTWSIAILRYFNPIGADKQGLLGENPLGIPNNLMPYIIKVATKELDHLNIYGNDYKTPDGTGVRDYIHVVDLAKGHVQAIKYIMAHQECDAYNLGTGIGYSVLDVVNTFMKVNQVKIPYVITDRRAGDVDACYADPTYAQTKLGFKATESLETMCHDAYQFAIKKL